MSMLSGAYEHILIRSLLFVCGKNTYAYKAVAYRCCVLTLLTLLCARSVAECCLAVAGRVAVCCSVLQCAAARVARLFGLLAPTFRALRHAFFIKGVTRDSYT